MADTPERRRAIGRIMAAEQETRAKIAELRTPPRKKEPSLADIDAKIEEEMTGVEHKIAELRKAVKDADQPALSMAAPFGIHVSAKGGVVWLVAILIALLAGGFLFGRVTAPIGQKETPAAVK